MTSLSPLKSLAIGAALLLPASAHAEQPAASAYPAYDANVSFPAAVRARQDEGAFVNPWNVRSVQPGMTKKQIYTLLDTPHFSEGLFGVKVWNYVFHFRQPGTAQVLTCQMRVEFGRKSRVERTYLSSPECVRLVHADSEAGLAAQPAAAAGRYSDRDDAADGKRAFTAQFGFDSYDINEQTAAVLSEVRAELAVAQYAEIAVTGFTDKVGPDSYNDTLAMMRAVQIQRALASSNPGIPIYVQASRDLEVRRPEGQREARNRKVQIELFETPNQPSPRIAR